MNHFTPWVCSYYGVADGAMDWSGIIWSQAGKDSKAAFNLFFDLFEKYLKEREEIGPEGIEAKFKDTLDRISKQDDGQGSGTPNPQI